jgi:hypothetical protein
MRHILLLLAGSTAMAACAPGCQPPAEQHIVHTIEPIRIEPIHIQQDITIKIEKPECATSQPTRRDAPKEPDSSLRSE